MMEFHAFQNTDSAFWWVSRQRNTEQRDPLGRSLNLRTLLLLETCKSSSFILDYLPKCLAQDSSFFLSSFSKIVWKPQGLATTSIAHWASPPLASWPISQAWTPENAHQTAQPQPAHPSCAQTLPVHGKLLSPGSDTWWSIRQWRGTNHPSTSSAPRAFNYHLHDPDNHDGVITPLEPDILECKVKWALGSITTNKATGGDGIPVELFQILKDDAVKVLHSICQHIWKTQQWLKDWKRPVFILIPKKGNAKECSNYHTLELISHSSKVIVKILQASLKQYMNHEFPDVQTGFRKGRGTRD